MLREKRYKQRKGHAQQGAVQSWDSKTEGREAADRLQGKYSQARLAKRLRRRPLSLRVVEATAEF